MWVRKVVVYELIPINVDFKPRNTKRTVLFPESGAPKTLSKDQVRFQFPEQTCTVVDAAPTG